MPITTSADGTTIDYDRSGSGPALILLGGPPTADRTANTGVAAALAPHFTVFNYDRRGRGGSGDTADYHIDCEYEDLAAVIDAAGGTAYAYGTSGGAIFAVEAAARGLSLTRLVLWEPPYIVSDSRPHPPADFDIHLADLLAADRRGDMVEEFFTVVIAMPAEFVAPMRDSPFWPGMEADAHTLIRDVQLMEGLALRPDRVSSVEAPTLVVDGGQMAAPWIRRGVETLAATMPAAEHRTLDGQPHNVDTDAIAAVVIDFLAG